MGFSSLSWQWLDPVELCVKAHGSVYFFEDDRYELYQIEQDPKEKIDLANQEEVKLDELKKLLNQWAAEMMSNPN